MNYAASIEYAKELMRERGRNPDDYHYEPIDVFGEEQERTDGLITIHAQNNLYILINPRNYYGVLILSDNSAFDSDHPNNNGVRYFTGLITIKRNGKNWNLDPTNKITGLPQVVPIEFLRVSDFKKRNHEDHRQ